CCRSDSGSGDGPGAKREDRRGSGTDGRRGTFGGEGGQLLAELRIAADPPLLRRMDVLPGAGVVLPVEVNHRQVVVDLTVTGPVGEGLSVILERLIEPLEVHPGVSDEKRELRRERG